MAVAASERIYRSSANRTTWTPADDALRLAANLVKDVSVPSSPDQTAHCYGWELRRLNPAMTYLDEREAVRLSKGLGNSPYFGFEIRRTGTTRRFARSRAGSGGVHEVIGSCRWRAAASP